ncbi:MAG: glycosyltransferase, partial [Candidatus Hodarchaeota archaeon]
MNVIVDGVIYQLQSNGGISRLYNEILPRMCDIDQSIRITLLTSGRLKQPVPKHQRICQRGIPAMEGQLFLGPLWNSIVPRVKRILYRLRIGYGKGKIWHSTYYTLPGKWKGMQVITVVDMIHERFANLFNGPGHEWFREQKRKCVLSADAVLCISETTRQEVQVFYDIDIGKIRVIPLAYSDVFKPLASADCTLLSPIAKPFLLYVGSRARYKNFDGLLSAYSSWAGRKEVDLVIVGESWTADEEQY